MFETTMYDTVSCQLRQHATVVNARNGFGKVFSTLLCVLSMILALGLGSVRAQSQSARFYYSVVQIASGVGGPDGLAVGANGNVYIADSSPNQAPETLAASIFTETPTTTNSVYQQTQRIWPGADAPGEFADKGIALDQNGNLFVSNVGIFGWTAGWPYVSNVTTGQSIGSNLGSIVALAIDTSGNLYLADSTNGWVVKETLQNGNYIQSTIATGLSSPSGVAVDTAGNVYVTDTGHQQVLKLTFSNGNYTQTTFVSGLGNPVGVAVGPSSGSIYITDSINNQVLKETPSDGGYTQTILDIGINAPRSIAVDTNENIYIGFPSQGTVYKLMWSPTINLGPSATGSAPAMNPSVPVTFIFTTAGKLGSESVVTQGATGTDFTDLGTGTCTANTTYNAGDTCTVIFSFSPKFPGTRIGAVLLRDTSGTTMATAYLQGTGTAVQLAFPPGVTKTIYSTAEMLSGIAVDSSNNLYVSDSSVGILSKIASQGTGAKTYVAQPLNDPTDVAVDGGGNVYTIQSPNQVVEMVLNQSGGYSTPVTLFNQASNGLRNPQSIAVDGSGNVYIADAGNHRVLMETLGPNGYVQSILASGLGNPYSVAVDTSGNVYFSDSQNETVSMLTLANGAYTLSTLFNQSDSELSSPRGIAVDANGNVYIADFGNNRVLLETLLNGNYTQSVIADNQTAGLVDPVRVAVDQTGNLYIATTGGGTGKGQLLEQDLADLWPVVFTPTGVGETSTDSPTDFTLWNIGTAAFTMSNFPALTGSNASSFTFSGGFQQGCDGPNTSCSINFSFAPLAFGANSASTILTDNAMNGGGTQTISLSGTGNGSQVIDFSIWTTTIGVSGSIPLSATATSGLPVTFRVAAGPGQITGNTLSFTGMGTVIVEADQAGNSNYNAAVPVQLSIEVVQNPQAITFTQVASPVAFSTTGISLAATASSGLPVTFGVISGPASLNGNTLTLSGLGTVVVAANQAGSVDYAPAIQVTQNITVVPSMAAHFYAQTLVNGQFNSSQIDQEGEENSMVLDGRGNLFIPSMPSAAALSELVPDASGSITGNSVVMPLATGFNDITSMAMNKKGDLVVSDSGQLDVVPASGGYMTINVMPFFEIQHLPLMVDGNGNAFWSMTPAGKNTTPQVIEMVADSNGDITTQSAYTQLTETGANEVAVTADKKNNVILAKPFSELIADSNGSVSTSSASLALPTYSISGTVDSAVVDPGGNLFFIADADINGAWWRNVNEVIASAGALSASSQLRTLEYSSSMQVGGTYSLPWPSSVVADGRGNLYVNDEFGGLFQLSTQELNFGMVNIGNSAGSSLLFTFDLGGKLGSISALTQGAANSEFTVANGGTCALNATYGAGSTCSVNVAFSPKYAGLQHGAVELLDSNGMPFSTAYLNGYGVGPQIRFLPSAQSQLASTAPFNTLAGAAVDGSGNVFAVDSGNNAIKEISPAGVVTPVAVANGDFSNPQGLAIDGAGNLFVADTGNGAIKEIVAASGYTTVIQLSAPSGTFDKPTGLALDMADNVFVTDSGNNAVYEVLASSSYTVAQQLAANFNNPQGVAVDAFGNVFVADTGNNLVKELTPGPNPLYSPYTVATVGSGFSAPTSLAIDSTYNVYVADSGNDAVKEITAASSYATVNTLNSGFTTLAGVTLDGAGNIYVTDRGTNGVYKLDYADPPSLTFSTATQQGTTDTADGPVTATIQNIGTANLIFPVPAAGNNPSISSSFSWNLSNSSACPELSVDSSPTVIAPLVSCTLAVSFLPITTGPISGSLSFATEYPNASPSAYSAQAIGLSGYGTAASSTSTLTILPAVLPAGTYGATYSQTFAASGGTAPYHFTVTAGSVPTGMTLAGAQLAGTPMAAGTYSFTVTATDSSTGGAQSVSQSYSLAINQASTTVTLSNLSQTYTGLAINASASAAPAVSAITLTYNGSATAPIFAGNYEVVATVNDPNYTGTASGTLTIAKASANVTLIDMTQTYNGSQLSAEATTTPANLNVSFTYNGSPTAPAAVGSYTVVATIGNRNYTGTATGTLVINPASQSISFVLPSSVVYGVQPIALTASGGASGLPISYNVVSGPGVIGAGVLTIGGVGTIVVGANQAAAADYAAAAEVRQTVVVSQAAQTIGFALPASVSYGVPPIELIATGGNSGNAVAFSVVSGPGTINGGTLKITGAGTVLVTANQAGNVNYAAAAPVQQSVVVSKTSTATSITSSSNPTLAKNSLTLTAVVGAAMSVPTGTVTFLDGTTSLGTGTLAGNAASITTSSLAVGTHSITAVYSGDGNFVGSSSGALSEGVLDITTTGTASSGGTTATAAPGGSATFNLAIVPSSGTSFPLPVTLTVSGQPAGATVTVTPSVWVAGTTASTWILPANTTAPANTQLVIQLPQSAAAVEHRGASLSTRLAPLSLALLLLPFAGILRRAGKRMGRVVSIVLLATASLAALASVTGCGGSSSSSTTGTGSSTSTITATVSAGALSHSTTFALTVQ